MMMKNHLFQGYFRGCLWRIKFIQNNFRIGLKFCFLFTYYVLMVCSYNTTSFQLKWSIMKASSFRLFLGVTFKVENQSAIDFAFLVNELSLTVSWQFVSLFFSSNWIIRIRAFPSSENRHLRVGELLISTCKNLIDLYSYCTLYPGFSKPEGYYYLIRYS